MKYIGFDLGDGESCISVLDTANPQLMPFEYSITGTTTFPTIVGTSEDGNTYIGNLVHQNMLDIRACFKRDFRTQTADVKESYRRFIKGVLAQIKSNHPTLLEGEYRFVIGQPADWDKTIIDSFIKLLIECGIDKPLLTSESRAALMYFSISNELGVDPNLYKESLLIIDLGSSTLDFAYLIDGNTDKVNVFGDPHLGGGLMDEEIVLQSINQLKDIEKKEIMLQILNEDATRRSLLMLEARKLKEAYFESNGELANGIKVCPIFSKGIPSFAIHLSDEIIHRVVSKPLALLSGNSFYSQLQDQLNKAKILTRETPPKLIILTGGASQMTFFREMCNDTFAKSDVQIRYSQSPAYDIARGLALAGRSEENLIALRKAVKQYIQGDLVINLVKGKLPTLVNSLADIMITSAMPDVIIPTLTKWKYYNEKTSLNSLNTQITQALTTYFTTEKCTNSMSDCIRKWSNSVFIIIQNEIDSLCRKYELHTSIIQIKEINLNIGNTKTGDALVISNVVDVVVGIILGAILGAICGGSGMALIASGVVGVVIGILIGFGVALLGTKFAKNNIMNIPLPQSIRKLIKEKNLDSPQQHKKMCTNLANDLLNNQNLINTLTTSVGSAIDQAIEEAATQQRIG